LYVRWVKTIESGPEDQLYQPRAGRRSTGESVLRSAAVIERTFGGLTANLWDDPFEWTLPEQLSTRKKVIEHLAEVESLRQTSFASFTDDACLVKHVATPSDETRPLIDLLLETLVSAVLSFRVV
jgi:hypothetical protein